MGRDFLGTYDLFADALLLFERGVHDPGHRAGALYEITANDGADKAVERFLPWGKGCHS
jgi:hypothetical protein